MEKCLGFQRFARLGCALLLLVPGCTKRGELGSDGGDDVSSTGTDAPATTDTGDVSSTGSDDAASAGTDDGGPCGSDPGEVCAAYVDFVLACYGQSGYEPDQIQAVCEADLNAALRSGCECRLALEDLLLCTSADCEAYNTCVSESEAYYVACELNGGEGDDGEFDEKAAVDVDALLDGGIDVVLSGSLAEVTIPLVGTVSAVPDNSTLQLYLEAGVSIAIISSTTGAQAALPDSWVTHVEGTPSMIGEYTWELNDARDTYRAVFYNDTPLGLMLSPSSAYTTIVSVAENPYIEALPPTTFQVSVSAAP